ncbi:MAG: hypothetical protein KGQ26_10695 [Rhodospirillales bacterium]|nr:hypothetical protein [Rhodospirillales bacterium]MDE2318713.1 hypothetical protein [Rhodospirillales bacterium]
MTNEPTGVYSLRRVIFDNEISNTQNIILSQGQQALTAMCQKIYHLYEILRSFPQLKDTYIHEDIPQTLSEICLHQGIASSILFNNSTKTVSENTQAYRLRLERYNYVRKFCENQSIDIKILSNRKVRNQLVHIDDHLAKALGKPNTGWFIDVAVAFRDQFVCPNGLELQFCRSFIVSEEVILHLENEISVRELWDEAWFVLGVVFGIPKNKILEKPEHSLR